MNIERPASRQTIPPDAKIAFKGTLFDVIQWEQELYDGTITTFERLKRPDTVVVIPCTTEKKILIEEEEQPGREQIITVPTGRMDEGEEPLEAAKRELMEETGYASDEWLLFKAYQPVMKIDWAIFVFVARNCRKVSEQSLDPGEKIRLQEVSLDEFIASERDPRFGSEELRWELIEARHSPEARALLEKKFFGT